MDQLTEGGRREEPNNREKVSKECGKLIWFGGRRGRPAVRKRKNIFFQRRGGKICLALVNNIWGSKVLRNMKAGKKE